ncbi:transmembrane protein 272-like isoform X1 [Cloeon dipterum]|uniref:transmembrane protein 272-like isoform X1 n=1 Tax=Cloeon dipterum TaxID=197152 RepID=UPI00321FF723
MECQEKGQTSSMAAVGSEGVGEPSQSFRMEIEPQNDFPSPSAPPLPPPSYEEAIAAPSVPPPSFQSLMTEIQNARETSEGLTDFGSKLCDAIANTVGITVVIFMFVGLFAILSVMVGMVVLGALYFHECPAQPMIPIMLIIGGTVLILLNIINCAKKKPQGEEERKKSSTGKKLFTFLFILWLGLSSYWVYVQYKPSSNPEDQDYCNPVLYNFYFWFLNVTNVILLLSCIC